MRSLTDKSCIKIRFPAVFILLICISSASLSVEVIVGEKNIRIDGPARVRLNDLAVSRTVCISSETMLHLPGSVKNIFVEKYDYPVSQFTEELRGYTVQQAVFWAVATLALGTSVRQR